MVAPGDEFSVTVGVFNNTRGTGSIHVQTQVSRELILTGASSSDLEIAEKREGVAEFHFKANAVLGPASLMFTAHRGRSEARIEESVSVRPAVAYRTQLTLGRFDSASTTMTLKRDLYPERRSVQASVSALPLVWGEGLIAYLDAYPYPCTEQLVSKGIAALLLASRPEFGAVKTRDAQPIAGTALHVAGPRERFRRLRSLGVIARDSGIPHCLRRAIPAGGTRPRPEGSARDAGQSRRMAHPIRIHTGRHLSKMAACAPTPSICWRARESSPPPRFRMSSRSCRIAQSETWSTDLAAAYLAATYRLMQRNSDADRIMPQRSLVATKAARDGGCLLRLPWCMTPNCFTCWRGISPTARAAFRRRRSKAIGSAISGNRVSSLSAAYTLLALDAYAKAAAPKVKLGIVLGGQRQASTSKVNVPVGIRTFNSPGRARSRLTIPSMSRALTATRPHLKSIKGSEVIHEFLDLKGNVTTSVKVGEEFWVRLRLRTINREHLSQVAVVDLLPGGVEPTLDRQAGPGSNWTPAVCGPAR